MGPLDRRIADLARPQHGAVTRVQLLEAGVPSSAVQRRVGSGFLRRLHEGVYVWTASGDRFGREAAALLACGERAALSHASAGAVRDLVAQDAPPKLVHVIVPGARVRRKGILAHQHRLRPDEVTCVGGLRQTTVGRTLVDLASMLDRRELEAAAARALDRRLVSRGQLRALLSRYDGHPGIARLRAVLEGDAALTRSEAEERVLSLVRSSGLPRPRTNARVCGLEVDFLWRSARVVVEVDGYEYHGSRQAFERDRDRDARLAAAGFRVVRVTWRQVTEKPAVVLVRLAQMLAGSQ